MMIAEISSRFAIFGRSVAIGGYPYSSHARHRNIRLLRIFRLFLGPLRAKMRGASRLMPPVLLFVSLLCLVSTETDPLDVAAIRALYRALNSPPQLKGWASDVADPCGGEMWHGVSCSGKSVTSIKIKGLGVGGQLGFNLSNFKNLNELDISENSIGGEIPDYLPPNATHLNLACNKFIMNVPFSFSYLKSLTHLNLSHNSLSGHIGNIFTDLHNLKYLDLSFNHFSGDLPISFTSLTHLHGLYLQENHFTGSVAFLAHLPLSFLNLENNHFSGVVPKQFESIQELKINGNMFQTGYAIPPPPYDIEYSPPSSSPRPPPGIFSSRQDCNVSNDFISALNCYGQSSLESGQRQRVLSWGIAACGLGGLIFMGLIIAIIVAFGRRSRKKRMKNLKRSCDPDISLPVTSVEGTRLHTDHLILEPPSVSAPTTASFHQTRSSRVSGRRFSLRRLRGLPTVKLYSASDLLLATNNFNERNFLGSSLFGSTYRADFPGGQICAVKKLEIAALPQQEEELFMDFVWNMSRLKHPSIIRLLGYSVEQGQHILVYEYMKNGSLDYMLHSSNETKKLLSWRTRVKIAVGVARALQYLHWASSPPIAYENLRATNVLLDDKLMPHLSDCGLAMLRPLINTESKASNHAASRTGYTAPEFAASGADKTKSDVFSFGVLLLELLTGRKPWDTSRGREEESLVMWASSRLHDIAMLEDMTDPAIKSSVTAQVLSRFADIVLPCIQPHPEFRPVINEVGDQLTRLLGKIHRQPRDGRGAAKEAGAEPDVSEFSFKTALSQLERYSQVSALNKVASSSSTLS